MASHGCSRDRGARGPLFDSLGNRPFIGCQLKMRYRLDSKQGLGLMEKHSKSCRIGVSLSVGSKNVQQKDLGLLEAHIPKKYGISLMVE